ncbi:Kelch repeat-containing protein [Gemmata sp.]|uniref:Kelch repeat-containing protein n=1 Tax=Gemmata sp. TaxID=1914242 RepID=UPI003F6F020A
MRTLPLVLVLLVAAAAPAAEPAPNSWVRTDAVIEGRRWDVPLGFDPVAKRFTVLGGRTASGEYKKPRPFDVLSFDPAGAWRNDLPPGTDWGPEVGPVTAPAWKGETWALADAAGGVRPNWTVYGTFSLGQKYDYDPDTKAFYFYAGGSTFRYEPATRAWKDMAPETHPQKALGGILLWSSMCYDHGAKKFVLFGGGNITTDRGDPGTWTYSPADNKWEPVKAERQPPARANARLAYDHVTKKVVLFGGDRLDQLVADTWAFDTATGTWTELKPPVSPAPRGGHALLWLPKAKKLLLVGGYTYTSTTDYVASLYRPLPLEAWVFDAAAAKWELVARWDNQKGKPAVAPVGPSNVFVSAAVDGDDTVLLLDAQNRAWTCRFDLTKPDAAGAEAFGTKPGTVVKRTGSHDPAWYAEGVPAADPAKVAADLNDLPANRWVVRATPKRPLMNMDWGSAVFDVARDKIVRFSGGHSAYSGTAPQVYDVRTDRYSLPFAPEYPAEYVYTNDQVHGEWSFKGNPWMTGHTYKSTGYDPNLKAFLFAPHEWTYFFDADTGKWSRSPEKNPYRPNFYVVTVCGTPAGAVVWADPRQGEKGGLWRLDAASRTWKPLPLKGELPAKTADQHGMAHDAKRDRLLLFSGTGPKKGNVAAYDLKTGEAKWLDPPGADSALVHCRETAYLPDADLVLIGGRVKDAAGAWRWLSFDCAANAWASVELPGDDPVGKAGAFNNSMGLMYDPARKLVWAVGQHSHVHALRFDPKTASVAPLK